MSPQVDVRYEIFRCPCWQSVYLVENIPSPECYPVSCMSRAFPSPPPISFVEFQQILHLTALPARKFYIFGSPLLNQCLQLYITQHLQHSALVNCMKHSQSILLSKYSKALQLEVRVSPHHTNVISCHISCIPRARLESLERLILSLQFRVDFQGTIQIGGRSRLASWDTSRLPTLSQLWRPHLLSVLVVRLEQVLFRTKVLDSLSGSLPIHPQPTIIISTIPAIFNSPSGPTEVDDGLLSEYFSSCGGAAVEVAYQRMTRLLALADGKKNQGWVSVEGIELLLEQGYEQFKIFTGRRVPKKLVRQPVFEVYERNMAHLE